MMSSKLIYLFLFLPFNYERLTFFPSGIEVSGVFETLARLKNVTSEMKILGEGAIPFNGGLYPWSWKESEMENFKALQSGLLVAPILSKLIFDREPERVVEWANVVSKWPIKRIIPCHFENNIRATGADFRKAFAFLEPNIGVSSKSTSSLFSNKLMTKNSAAPLPADLNLLNKLSDIFTLLGVVAPSRVNNLR